MRPFVPLIKICGLSTPETLAAAIDAETDMVGFVFFAKSPRNLALDRARRLAEQARGRALIVALSVDAEDAALAAIVDAVQPDWLQLHGRETPERVDEIKRRFGVSVMKAVGIASPSDLAAADDFKGVADRLLFDAKPPADAVLPGGNGFVFDWTLLRGQGSPFMLSGGLSCNNVRDAVRISGAFAVDVSSGVESSPGVKDPALIRDFIDAARA